MSTHPVGWRYFTKDGPAILVSSILLVFGAAAVWTSTPGLRAEPRVFAGLFLLASLIGVTAAVKIDPAIRHAFSRFRSFVSQVDLSEAAGTLVGLTIAPQSEVEAIRRWMKIYRVFRHHHDVETKAISAASVRSVGRVTILRLEPKEYPRPFRELTTDDLLVQVVTDLRKDLRKDMSSKLVLDMRDIPNLDNRTLRDLIKISIYISYQASAVRIGYLHYRTDRLKSVADLITPANVEVYGSEAEVLRSVSKTG